jgi:hypothetical protein
MKILGFGDSFMLGNRNRSNYMSILSERINSQYEMYGDAGCGPWSAFFRFLDYPDKDSIDVVIFAWSEYTRLYHRDNHPLNYTTGLHKKSKPSNSAMYEEIYEAAHQYYKHLFDYRKLEYEGKALFHMIDDMATEYPNIKFVHMHCFAHQTFGINKNWDLYKKDTYDHLEYLYKFKNGINIQPALCWLSFNDEMVDDFANDTNRSCHLSQKMHNILSDTLYTAITTGKNGDIIKATV